MQEVVERKALLVSWDRHNNDHQLGGLKQHKFLLSQFCRLEVWRQDVSRATVTKGSREEFFLAFSNLRWLLVFLSGSVMPASVPSSSSFFFLFLFVLSSSYKDLVIRFRAHTKSKWFHLKPLANYICSHPVASMIIFSWGSGWTQVLEGHYSTHYRGI